MAANVIAENLFAQVDQEGNRFVLIESIIDTRTDGTQTLQKDAFVITKNGTKRRKNTTKLWEVCIQWKDGSTTCNKLKDIKYLYPVQMAEYKVENIISEEDSIIVIKMALYGLKSSGAVFRAKLVGLLHDIGYTPSKVDPDVWMRPAIKSDGT